MEIYQDVNRVKYEPLLLEPNTKNAKCVYACVVILWATRLLNYLAVAEIAQSV